jgi:hypothetical protein
MPVLEDRTSADYTELTRSEKRDKKLGLMAVVSSMKCKGMRNVEIAKQTGIPISLVNYVMTAVRKKWKEQLARDIEILRAEQLAELQEVKRAAWANGKGADPQLTTITKVLQLESEITGTNRPADTTANVIINVE